MTHAHRPLRLRDLLEALLAVAITVLAVGGCGSSQTGDPGDQSGVGGPVAHGVTGGTVTWWHDDAHHVSCWVFNGWYKGGISCLPDSQVTEP